MAAHFVGLLVEHAQDDERIWLIDGDLADSYGATAFAEAHADRFIMAGIAEQNMVSLAAGMARCGARPFVFSFAAFLAYRAADQIRVSLAQSRLPVTLIASHAGGCSGRNGRSHSAVGDIATIGSMPGMHIWAPADRHDVALAFAAVLQGSEPSYCRGPREALPDLPMSPGPVRLERRDGKVVLFCCGISSHWAIETQTMLFEAGIPVDVVSVAQIHPLPAQIDLLLADGRPIVVIEDHVRLGGLADHITARSRRAPDLWFGWRDHPPGGDVDAVRAWAGLDASTIANTIRVRLRL